MGAVVMGLLTLVTVGACDASDGLSREPTAGTVTGDQPPVSGAVGPGLSIREALNSKLDQPLLVNGMIVDRDGATRLCSLLAESYPPQCGGESVVVEGLNLDSFGDLDTAEGVTWSRGPVQLLGRVSNGVLTISTRQSA